jgi:hypothetical protein
MRLEIFELKEEHLTLLRNAALGWITIETGAPGIDPKRPYGNSWVVKDVARILNIDLPDDDHEKHEEVCWDLMEWHKETLTALQILIDTGQSKLGTYHRTPYHRWTWAGK